MDHRDVPRRDIFRSRGGVKHFAHLALHAVITMPDLVDGSLLFAGPSSRFAGALPGGMAELADLLKSIGNGPRLWLSCIDQTQERRSEVNNGGYSCALLNCLHADASLGIAGIGSSSDIRASALP